MTGGCDAANILALVTIGSCLQVVLRRAPIRRSRMVRRIELLKQLLVFLSDEEQGRLLCISLTAKSIKVLPVQRIAAFPVV